MLPQIEFTLSIMRGEGKWVRSEDIVEVEEVEELEGYGFRIRDFGGCFMEH